MGSLIMNRSRFREAKGTLCPKTSFKCIKFSCLHVSRIVISGNFKVLPQQNKLNFFTACLCIAKSLSLRIFIFQLQLMPFCDKMSPKCFISMILSIDNVHSSHILIRFNGDTHNSTNYIVTNVFNLRKLHIKIHLAQYE